LLEQFVRNCDVVVHLAGVICGDEQILIETNIALTRALIEAMEQTDRRPHVLFASSTHIHRNTAYGRSKQACTDLWNNWARDSGACFSNLILPNVFGEGGKPFYNSVVSTFCFQLANGQEPQIINDIQMQQLHAQTLARTIYDIIIEKRCGDLQTPGQQVKVSGLLDRLRFMDAAYRIRHEIPRFDSGFDLELFNTLRSYYFPHIYPVSIDLKKDSRGELFEAVKSLGSGQVFISHTRPGITRGNHYHLSKVERFFVLQGRAEIRLRRLFSKQVYSFKVNGATPTYIDMPTLYTHSITNIGSDDLITLFWSHEIFDPDNPETYPEAV